MSTRAPHKTALRLTGPALVMALAMGPAACTGESKPSLAEAMKKADEAISPLEEALSVTTKPELRDQMWTTLVQSRSLVTEQSLDATREAVMLQLEGEEPAAAKAALDALAKAHPQHPSVSLRQARL